MEGEGCARPNQLKGHVHMSKKEREGGRAEGIWFSCFLAGGVPVGDARVVICLHDCDVMNDLELYIYIHIHMYIKQI